jgi:hypothetical protein
MYMNGSAAIGRILRWVWALQWVGLLDEVGHRRLFHDAVSMIRIPHYVRDDKVK